MASTGGRAGGVHPPRGERGPDGRHRRGALTAPIGLKTRITSPRFAETRDWYCDLFGLELLEQWDEPRDQGCILGIGDAGGHAFLEIYFGEQTFDFTGLSLQFRVEDVARFEIPDEPRFAHRGPEVRPWGSHYLFLTDPNGVMVVIFSGTSL